MQTLRLNKFGIALVVILILSIFASIIFYIKASRLERVSSGVEAQNIIEEVGRLIMLPEDEKPTVATVSEPEKIKNQPFFARAKAGDKVLIYVKSKKAYLYDPVARKLVEVAPLSSDDVTSI